MVVRISVRDLCKLYMFRCGCVSRAEENALVTSGAGLG